MKSPNKFSIFHPWRMVFALVVFALLLVILLQPRRQAESPAKQTSAAAVKPTSSTTPNRVSATIETNLAVHFVSNQGAAPNSPGFQIRPFPASVETASAQWTAADGKDTNVIRQLAHNPLEYDRMVEENSRIFRRQLVYLKDTAAAVFERAKLTAASVQQLTLPGMDGQELQFEIVQSDSNGSSRHGMFSGHLAGNADSMVTFAFQDGREAFTVISPKDNIYLVGEPRENSQVLVKAIDPNTSGLGPPGGDDFVLTDGATK